MDAIVKALRASGEVDVVEADYLVHSPEEAKLQGAENGRGGCGRNYFLLWRVQLS